MSQRVKALITPAVLKWARESAGLTVEEAAARLKRSADELAQWETGESQPTIPQARKAANVYKRPLAALYLPEPPKDFQILQDFRCLPSGRSSTYSPELAMLVRNAQDHQAWARDYLEEIEADALDFVGSVGLHDNPASVARGIRKTLGVTLDDVFNCRTRDQALSYWIKHVEDTGVFVFRNRRVDCDEARGFAISDNLAPFIFVNTNDSKSAQIFTLLHELVHIFLDWTGISNLLDFPVSQRNSSEARTEVFCNRVASEIVLERSAFNTAWQNATGASLENRIYQISNRFNISREVVARRLLEQRVIDRRKYLELHDQYVSDWKDEKAREKRRNKESDGGPSPHMLKTVTNGYAFTSLVISAYRSGAVSGRETSAILGVKLNHLEKVAAHAYFPFGRGT